MLRRPPDISDPRGAVTSARPVPGAKDKLCYIALICRGHSGYVSVTHLSSLVGGAQVPNCRGEMGPSTWRPWESGKRGLHRLAAARSGAQTTPSAASGRHLKGARQPYWTILEARGEGPRVAEFMQTS